MYLQIHIIVRFLHIGDFAMRTNIEIDDELMKEAMKVTGATTKKAAVEEALQLFVSLRGKPSTTKKVA